MNFGFLCIILGAIFIGMPGDHSMASVFVAVGLIFAMFSKE